MSRLARQILIGIAVLATLAVSSCGDGGTGSEGATTTEQDSTTPTSEPPTGEPIKLAVIADDDGPQRDVIDGAQAAAAAINRDGGVVPAGGGTARPVEIVVCDIDFLVPSSSADCAREMAEEGVVLSVAKFGLTGAIEGLSEAKIASFGNIATGIDDFTDPLSFPLNGGVTATVPGTAVGLQRAGATDLAIMTLDAAEARALPGFVTPVLKNGTDDLSQVVYLPTDPSADIQGLVAQVVDAQPSAVMIVSLTDTLVRVVKSLRQVGYEGLIGSSAGLLTEDALEELGADAEGMVLASAYEPLTSTDNPVIANFLDDLEQQAPDAARSEFSLAGWLAVREASKIMATLSVIDAPSMTAALDGRVIDTGVSPPFTLGTPGSFTGFPRVFSATIQVQEVSDEKVVSSGDGEFIDLNELSESATSG